MTKEMQILMNEWANMDNLCLPPIQMGVKGREVLHSIDHYLWNKIPSEIRNKQNLIGFKKSMLEHFVISYKDFCHVILNHVVSF